MPTRYPAFIQRTSNYVVSGSRNGNRGRQMTSQVVGRSLYNANRDVIVSGQPIDI